MGAQKSEPVFQCLVESEATQNQPRHGKKTSTDHADCRCSRFQTSCVNKHCNAFAATLIRHCLQKVVFIGHGGEMLFHNGSGRRCILQAASFGNRGSNQTVVVRLMKIRNHQIQVRTRSLLAGIKSSEWYSSKNIRHG